MDAPGMTTTELLEELAAVRQRLAILEASEHDRAAMQAELQRSEANYRELVEGVNSIILRMDRRGALTYANQFAYRFLGYSKEEILGKNVVGTIVPPVESTGRDLSRHIRDLCQHPEQFKNNENENLCRDGRRVWIAWTNKPVRDEHGRVTEILCIGNDITHRRQFEQALEASQRYCRDLFDATTDAIVVLDPPTCQFVDANPATFDMTGYTREEFFSLTLGDLCDGRPPYTAELAAQTIGKAAEEGPQVLDWRARRKNGEVFWVEATLKRVSIEGKRHVLAVVADVSARREAEERVRREQKALRQLFEAQEWERRLIAYEIHDGLAQLLTGATMQFEVSEKLHGENHEASAEAFFTGKRLLDEALAETRRLIRGLRPAVLDESGAVAAIEHLISEGRGQPGPRVEFHHDVQFERLDPMLENTLFRIAQESLTNARRYSQGQRVEIRLTQSGDRVTLAVHDDGVGFDPDEVRPNSFGLRGIHERARLLGGQATIISRPGQGATVRVELPIEPSWAGGNGDA
ncbi:MAG: PAS domain S-box protein [Pirellulales bacterium]|nr:PAS domain S-box protein [Pirellulales bacterium]